MRLTKMQISAIADEIYNKLQEEKNGLIKIKQDAKQETLDKNIGFQKFCKKVDELKQILEAVGKDDSYGYNGTLFSQLKTSYERRILNKLGFNSTKQLISKDTIYNKIVIKSIDTKDFDLDALFEEFKKTL